MATPQPIVRPTGQAKDGCPVLLTTAALVAAVPLAHASPNATSAPACSTDRYAGSERVTSVNTAGGQTARVLLPASYATDQARRYPVLYLLHGALSNSDSWLVKTDLVEFTAAVPGGQDAIVVLPQADPIGATFDWSSGAFRPETGIIGELIPLVDGRFRTIADRSHRAIAGLSGGGLGAASLAARHPDRFSVVATFSGLVDITGNVDGQTNPANPVVATALAAGALSVYQCAGDVGPFDHLGNPVNDELNWHAHNPTDLAGNLAGMSVDVYTGDGIPCDVEDVTAMATSDFTKSLEPLIRQLNENFHAALVAAGVPHGWHPHGCGVHSWRYWERDLHDWWAQMIAAFGAPPPQSFNFRSTDSGFSVWGWTFATDPARPAEFLDVTGASPDGVTLTGSGVVRVTTPADAYGHRCSFTVDLGPPHRHPQFTVGQRAAEALASGRYWRTRSVLWEEPP